MIENILLEISRAIRGTHLFHTVVTFWKVYIPQVVVAHWTLLWLLPNSTRIWTDHSELVGAGLVQVD